MALSFVGDFVSRRILLPNVILLIILGIICGPVLGLFNRESLVAVIPFLAPLTIAFIGFDAGIHMDVYEVMKQSRRAVILSVLGFLLSTTVVGIFLHVTFAIRWAYAFLLASAWGGVNTATVVAVSRHLKIGGKALTTLTMSSLIDDMIVLISALTILNYVTLGGMELGEISLGLVGNMATSIFLGATLGIAWLNILHFSRRGEYTFTFTLAAILLVYSATEMLGGTGGIAIFLFGLILGNSKAICSSLKMKVESDKLSDLLNLIGKFHSELTFVITTFFFTFIGLTYVFTGVFELFLGLVISVLLHATRLVAVRLGTRRSSMKSDLPAIGLIVGKGVASAAVSTLPLAYGLPNTSMFTSIALNVILITNIISIVLPILAARSQRR